MFFLGFVVPFILICYCYGRIMVKVKQTENRAMGEKARNQGRKRTWSKGRKLFQAVVAVVNEPLMRYGVTREGYVKSRKMFYFQVRSTNNNQS